jgi:hypothetical protein
LLTLRAYETLAAVAHTDVYTYIWNTLIGMYI